MATPSLFEEAGEEVEPDFVEPLPKNLRCPLCRRVFADPVISGCGHSFCRGCGTRSSSLCPLDGTALSVVVANLAVEEQLSELGVRCPFGGPDDCPDVVAFSARKAHEAACEFGPVRCPIARSCGEMQKRLLAAHLERSHTRLGLEDGVQIEIPTGGVESTEASRLDEIESRLSRQERQIKAKDEEIGFLRSLVTKLSDRVERLEIELGHVSEISARADLDVVDIRRDLDEMAREIRRRAVSVGGSTPRHRRPSEPSADGKELKCLGTFVGHQGPVWSLAQSDGLLFSGSSDGCVKIWDDFVCVETIDAHRETVLSLAVFGGADGASTWLVSGSGDGSMSVWSVSAGRESEEELEVERRQEIPDAHDQSVCSFAVDAGVLASTSFGLVKTWALRPKSARPLKLLIELGRGILPEHWVRAAIFNSSGLVVGCQKQISLWDVERGSVIRSASVSQGSVHSLLGVSERSLLIVGTSEGEIQLRDGRSLEYVESLSGHQGTLGALSAVPASRSAFASAGADAALRLWDGRQGRGCVADLTRHSAAVNALVAGDQHLFSAASDSSVKVWSYQ